MSDPNGANLEDPRLSFNKFDYEFLTGTWKGGWGAAMSIVMEYCRGAGLGTFGKPTERGFKGIERYRKEHR